MSDDKPLTLVPPEKSPEKSPEREKSMGRHPTAAAVNAATTAGVFVSLADGLEDGTIQPRAAALVLREYAKILWESTGHPGDPERLDLARKQPDRLVSTDGRAWTAWAPGPGGLTKCGHNHRTRNAAEKCFS